MSPDSIADPTDQPGHPFVARPIVDPALGTETVAQVLRVSARTVTKLIDSGQLLGYRIPGGTARRVLRSDLMAFCDRAGLPEAFRQRAAAAVRPYAGRRKRRVDGAGE